MSGSTRRRATVGITAVGALVLAMVPVGAVQAAQNPVKGDPVSKVAAAARAAGGSGFSTFKVADDRTHVPSLCTITSYAPTKAVIGAQTVKPTFSVKVTGCTLDIWAVGIVPFMSDDPESLAGIATSDQPKISLSPKVLRNTDAGKAEAIVEAEGVEDPPDDDPTFQVDPALLDTTFLLERRSSFGTTFNATPEPVKKGKNITLKATLKRVNWDGKKMPYVGYSGQSIQVQFKAAGTTSYKTVKTVTSGKDGKISTTIKASKSGRWRLVYGGRSTTGPATSGTDAVVVK